MAEGVRLKGITWDHSRGYDPMVATSAAFCEVNPGVNITWEKRSLQAFADRPIEEMAGEYDLMVIDHPHVGEVAGSGMLLALDGIGHEDALGALSDQSVGPSHRSYEFDDRQWALAIDAATPVAAFRPDRINEAPRRWSEVLDLARDRQVGFALIPINALMTYFGLAKNKGYGVAEGAELMLAAQSEEILELMREIVDLMDEVCLKLDPIGIYEWLGRTDEAPAYSPFGYGYTNYSRDGYCRFPLVFADAPGFDDNGPRGTVIGGTGVAISARTQHPREATEYAFWIAGAECQKGLFFESGGQPGNASAWEDDACNDKTRNFFRNTRETLETSWLRPRYDGYMNFQALGGDIVHAFLRGNSTVGATVKKLQSAYELSLQ
ncbi:MAG: extracellular solute-binding protein [Marinovum sp.]|jgi:multiple sugar transport system substrate-binding protein|nr:extracellular solute-binding protein [Marinovum sp.]MBT6526315.1 extracellular solute-binding protein [Marinovum sp.]